MPVRPIVVRFLLFVSAGQPLVLAGDRVPNARRLNVLLIVTDDMNNDFGC